MKDVLTAVAGHSGYRNGCGKPRKLTLTCGTITVRRPRLRAVEERFVSRAEPLALAAPTPTKGSRKAQAR